jgi:hypothetical protein
MRKILNYLFGEDAVNEQSNREIREALCLAAVIIPFAFAVIILSLII